MKKMCDKLASGTRDADPVPCKETAKFMPVLLVWAKGDQPRTVSYPPARMVWQLGLCAQHAQAATVDDFLTDEGWQKICGAFRLQGHAEPDRSTAMLEIVKWSRFPEPKR